VTAVIDLQRQFSPDDRRDRCPFTLSIRPILFSEEHHSDWQIQGCAVRSLVPNTCLVLRMESCSSIPTFVFRTLSMERAIPSSLENDHRPMTDDSGGGMQVGDCTVTGRPTSTSVRGRSSIRELSMAVPGGLTLSALAKWITGVTSCISGVITPVARISPLPTAPSGSSATRPTRSCPPSPPGPAGRRCRSRTEPMASKTWCPSVDGFPRSLSRAQECPPRDPLRS
jgi:hypothetical protein